MTTAVTAEPLTEQQKALRNAVWALEAAAHDVQDAAAEVTDLVKEINSPDAPTESDVDRLAAGVEAVHDSTHEGILRYCLWDACRLAYAMRNPS